MSDESIRPVGWRQKNGSASLSDVFRTVGVRGQGSFGQRLSAWLGPGFLVAVGYMDPGNWATSIAGGARFGYALLFIALLSSLMAMLLQSLSARLAIATGRDLAQACRDAYPRPVSFALWILAEIAIIATDIAEVVGTAIGLNLLFGLPLALGVLITALDVFLVLALQRYGFRKLEIFVVSLLAVIFASFAIQIFLAQPQLSGIAAGLLPTPEVLSNPEMLYLALGIIGATVMPHNLYLHSGIVQTRAFGESPEQRRGALKFAQWDSNLALSFAFLVNASLLILAAATFNKSGYTGIAEIGEAQRMLAPLLGSLLAPKLFAIALLACGLNSTLTATLAGQIVMEGFLDLRLPAWARRLATRLLAIVPAILVTIWFGMEGTGFLLIFSQVVLAFQLPFAIVPLLMFVGDRHKMNSFAIKRPIKLVAWAVAALIIGLNLKLIWDLALGGA
jgi:manganese transport protein